VEKITQKSFVLDFKRDIKSIDMSVWLKK